MKSRFPRRYGWSNQQRHFTILLVVAIAGIVTSLILGGILVTSSTSDAALHDILYARARLEESSAREITARLSRTGGTNTQHQLALLRQHLYALEQLNALSDSLLTRDKTFVPSDLITQAVSHVDRCETLLLTGQAIDSPMMDLRSVLSEIEAAIGPTE